MRSHFKVVLWCKFKYLPKLAWVSVKIKRILSSRLKPRFHWGKRPDTMSTAASRGAKLANAPLGCIRLLEQTMYVVILVGQLVSDWVFPYQGCYACHLLQGACFSCHLVAKTSLPVACFPTSFTVLNILVPNTWGKCTTYLPVNVQQKAWPNKDKSKTQRPLYGSNWQYL